MRQPPFLPSGHGRLLRILLVVGLALGLGAMASLPEQSPLQPHLSFCAFRNITGLPCPLCGGTRSAAALLHGDYSRALQLNALAIPATILLFGLFLLLLAEAIAGRPLVHWSTWGKRWPAILCGVALLLLLWWIPQLMGALNGSKPELLDLSNPIARTLSGKFNSTRP